MLKRIVVGVLAALLAIGLVCIRYTPVFPLAVALFTGLAVSELERVIGVKNRAIFAVSLIFSALTPLYHGFRFELAGRGFELPVTVVLDFYVLLLFLLLLFDRHNTKFEELAAVLVTTIFLPWGFSTLILLRDLDRTYPALYDRHHGLFFILLGMFCAWLADTFAYFTGRFFGKHRLAPSVSPKKTVEGAVGGVFFAVLGSLILFAVFDSRCFAVHILSWWQILLLSFFLSVIGICGDLTASVIKRNFGVKDYGRLFPGHGGVMDRLDSALFVFSALYGLVTVFSRTVAG